MVKIKKFLYIFDLLQTAFQMKNPLQMFSLAFAPGKLRKVDFRGGYSFHARHLLDLLVVKEIFLNKDYKLDGLQLKNIVDIGGNIGVFSIYAAKMFPGAKIHCFEPAPETFETLQKNIQLNGANNVTLHHLAVAGSNGKLRFYQSSASGLSSLYTARKDGNYVDVDTVDFPKMLELTNLPTIDLLKIDCEGAEYDMLLKLPADYIGKAQKIYMEYHDGITPHRHEELVSYLKESGFNVQLHPHPIENDIGIIVADRA